MATHAEIAAFVKEQCLLMDLPPGPRCWPCLRRLPMGELNSIADVQGCASAIAPFGRRDPHRVTAVIPQAISYREKPVAAVHVLNGFGKAPASCRWRNWVPSRPRSSHQYPLGWHLLRRWCATPSSTVPDIGRETATVNPVVFECNDGYLNDIQALAVTQEDARAARGALPRRFEVGSVGAGCGMSTFGFKGSIGQSSGASISTDEVTIWVCSSCPTSGVPATCACPTAGGSLRPRRTEERLPRKARSSSSRPRMFR